MFPGNRFDLKISQPINKYKYVKAFLLIFASVTFALVIFGPSLKEIYEAYKRPAITEKPSLASASTLPKEDESNIKNSATDIRFHGMDKSKQPYLLIAEDGNENDQNVVFLNKPKLTLNLKSGSTVTLTALEGSYDKTKSLISLEGEVVVSHSSGYQFTTSLAWIDLTQSIAYGEQKVVGHGPKGEIQAEGGFKLLDKGDKVIFQGRPELVLKNRKES